MMPYMNGFGNPSWSLLFILMMLWSLFWKALGLWHSAKRGEQWWFLAMLVINTAGILEIVYLFAVAKMKKDQVFRWPLK